MIFRVGQKVECVSVADLVDTCLKQGAVYTCLAVDPEFIGVDCCASATHEHKLGWFHWRFRPIVERKTDISIFKKMLAPAKEDACTSS